MNKKGMTLIEAMFAVMIIAIASLMLFSIFKNVSHYMSKSTSVKLASDETYAVLEGNLDASVSKKVSQKGDPVAKDYSIVFKGNSINVNGSVETWHSATNEDILLRKFGTTVERRDDYWTVGGEYERCSLDGGSNYYDSWEPTWNGGRGDVPGYNYGDIVKHNGKFYRLIYEYSSDGVYNPILEPGTNSASYQRPIWREISKNFVVYDRSYPATLTNYYYGDIVIAPNGFYYQMYNPAYPAAKNSTTKVPGKDMSSVFYWQALIYEDKPVTDLNDYFERNPNALQPSCTANGQGG